MVPTQSVTAIKLRKKLPLLRAGSQAPAWEPAYLYNLMAVTQSMETMSLCFGKLLPTIS